MNEEKNNIYSATEQPDPSSNTFTPCWELVLQDMRLIAKRIASRECQMKEAIDQVMQDMKDRDEWGHSKYGTPLQPFNGRNALVDFYQEILDAAVYCRQTIEEDKAMLGWLEIVAADLEKTCGVTAFAYCQLNKAIDLLRARYKIE